VKECDDYFTRFEACLPKFPAESQQGVKTAIGLQRGAFRKQIATPEGRTAAVEACKKLTEQLAKNPACG
jgi:hypothetical protein